MINKELQEELKKLPDDAEVVIDLQTYGMMGELSAEYDNCEITSPVIEYEGRVIISADDRH